jgi:mono/diheme cytochrome c family protein
MHAPASTFEHRGRQYVIAFSAGNALIGSARGDSVWLFGLDGTLPPAAPGSPVPRSTAVTPPAAGTTTTRTDAPGVAPANLVRGRQLYAQACEVCHGADGKGGHGVGAPLTAATDLAAVVRTVTAGRSTMPPFSASFTPEQIRDVSAYVVQTLAGGAR